jgi:phi13 family phage major tail protein
MSPLTYAPAEQKSKIGLDSLYFALVTQDDNTAYVAGTPEYLAPSATASMEPQSTFSIQYADNQPYEVMAAEAETKITLEVTGLSLLQLATIIGRSFDAATGRMYDNGSIPPYIALGFRTLKSNGHYRYFWILKGKFSMPKEDVATLADKPDPKSLQIIFTAIRTTWKFSLPNSVTDSVKRVIGDDDTANFTVAATWFSQVQTPTSTAPGALTVTPDPTNGASAVAVSKVCTLTFSNALNIGEEFNCVLVNNATHVVIAGTNTIDATRKIVTVGHTAALPSTVSITMNYAVRDIFNQLLSGVSSFTTV